MEARNSSLHTWFARIRNRQIVLPRFQRFEAWTHRMVADLLDTVLRELPAGALLVLEVGEEEPFLVLVQTGKGLGDNGIWRRWRNPGPNKHSTRSGWPRPA